LLLLLAATTKRLSALQFRECILAGALRTLQRRTVALLFAADACAMLNPTMNQTRLPFSSLTDPGARLGGVLLIGRQKICRPIPTTAAQS
jgi:hypothetical protein